MQTQWISSPSVSWQCRTMQTQLDQKLAMPSEADTVGSAVDDAERCRHSGSAVRVSVGNAERCRHSWIRSWRCRAKQTRLDQKLAMPSDADTVDQQSECQLAMPNDADTVGSEVGDAE